MWPWYCPFKVSSYIESTFFNERVFWVYLYIGAFLDLSKRLKHGLTSVKEEHTAVEKKSNAATAIDLILQSFRVNPALLFVQIPRDPVRLINVSTTEVKYGV